MAEPRESDFVIGGAGNDAVGDWDVRDGDYVVGPWAFWSHCRGGPPE